MIFTAQLEVYKKLLRVLKTNLGKKVNIHDVYEEGSKKGKV